MDQAVIGQVLSQGPVAVVLPSADEQMFPKFKEPILELGNQLFLSYGYIHLHSD
jgi:hypothetical protein